MLCVLPPQSVLESKLTTTHVCATCESKNTYTDKCKTNMTQIVMKYYHGNDDDTKNITRDITERTHIMTLMHGRCTVAALGLKTFLRST